MSNDTVLAAAGGLPTRRGAFAALAGIGAAVALPVAAQAASTTGTPGLAELWHAYLLAKGASQAIHAEYHRLHALLPWWAQPGPRNINAQGEHVGEVSNCPAIQDMALPEGYLLRVLRPDLRDIMEVHGHQVALYGQAKADAIRDQRQAAFEARLAAKDEEEHKLGLPSLYEPMEQSSDAVLAAQDAILNLPSVALDVVAAKVLITVAADCQIDEEANDGGTLFVAAMALTAFRPHLTGELAADVAEVIDNPGQPIRTMRISQGVVAHSVEVSA